VLGDYSAFAKSARLEGGTFNIEVMNVAGQIIEQQVVDGAFAKYELNMADHLSGIYFIRISGEGVEPEVHKVVKKE